MSFKNVEIKKKANVYHDGQVTSRTIIIGLKRLLATGSTAML